MIKIFEKPIPLQIFQDEKEIFAFLATALDNSILYNLCETLTHEFCYFSITSDRLQYIYEKHLRLLDDITLKIHAEEFPANSCFASLISTKVHHSLLAEFTPEFELTSSKDADDSHDTLVQFVRMLRGVPFSIIKYPLEDLQKAAEILEFPFPLPEAQEPTTFQQALHILSSELFYQYPQIFLHASIIIARNFDQIESSDFSSLTTRALDTILADAVNLTLQSENQLYELISKDPRKNYLFHYLIFPCTLR